MDMPKNRISLFFMVLKDHVFDLIKVNLMQLIFWIPFLLWTYINLAAVQSIDTETVLSHAEGGAAELLSAISGYLMMWLIGLIPVHRHHRPVVGGRGVCDAQLGARSARVSVFGFQGCVQVQLEAGAGRFRADLRCAACGIYGGFVLRRDDKGQRGHVCTADARAFRYADLYCHASAALSDDGRLRAELWRI